MTILIYLSFLDLRGVKNEWSSLEVRGASKNNLSSLEVRGASLRQGILSLRSAILYDSEAMPAALKGQIAGRLEAQPKSSDDNIKCEV